MRKRILTEENVKEILEEYSIGNYKNHRHLEKTLANDVYILKTSKGKYVLKVLVDTKPANMKKQLEIIDFLYSKGLPVVKNIKNNLGKELIKFKGRKLLIQDFVKGKQVMGFNNKLIEELAREIGRMHKIILGSKFGMQQRKYHIYKRRNQSIIKKLGLQEIQEDLFTHLSTLNKSKLRKARIHSDITESNILVKDNKLKALIDWDDSDYDYIIYDVAIFLTHSCAAGKRIQRKKIEIFMKEYNKYISLNDEETRAIYYLMNYRLFGILSWYIQYRKSHPERSEQMNKGIKRNTACLLRFKKFTLNDFLKLC